MLSNHRWDDHVRWISKHCLATIARVASHCSGTIIPASGPSRQRSPFTHPLVTIIASLVASFIRFIVVAKLLVIFSTAPSYRR